MSLFKLSTLWNTQCPDFSPNYDCYSLQCCRFGIDGNEKDYIVVGSHSGRLSIYKVNLEKLDNDALPEYRPTDVLLEMDFPHPILGLMTGKFLTTRSEEQQQLAILHPMKLSIYSINTKEGIAEHGHQSKLNICYEHKFNKFAFAFCKGRFGNVKDKEFLCTVQMDGSLKFFEQDGISLECMFPDNRNIPTVFEYISRTDCFVTVSTAYELECYRYQDMIESVETSKPIKPLWSTCIGEFALNMAVHQISNGESIIIILGEHNLLCISDNGRVKFIKRLEYTAVCFCSFVIGWYFEPNARLIIAVATDNGTLLIYEEKKIIWASQLSEVPVAIQRSNIQGLPGAIVTLGCTGNLQISYLGSTPYVFKVPPLNLHELNYVRAHKELTELEKEIKNGLDITDLPSVERDLDVDISFQLNLENCTYLTKLANTEDALKMCAVNVTLKSRINLEQIQIYFDIHYPLKCSQQLFLYRDLCVNDVEEFKTCIYMTDALNLPSLNVKVILSFINKQSLPRIIEKVFLLPLTLFFREYQPQKDAVNKIQISIEHFTMLPTIATLFSSDFNLENKNQAIGLKSLYSDSCVTIIAAKNSNRLRVQSDELETIPLILELLINRIIKYVTSMKSSVHYHQNKDDKFTKFKIIIAPEIPIDKILIKIDKHYEAVENLMKTRNDLEIITKQMRVILRRLYVKLEDKSKGALDGINLLFNDTHNKILTTLELLNKQRYLLQLTQVNLSCSIKLLKIVLKYLNVSSKLTKELSSALIQPITDWSNNSWEKTVASSLDMHNHLGPLRKNKNSSLDDHLTFAITNLDINRFKRHFASLLERVCQMASMQPQMHAEDLKDNDNYSTSKSTDDETNDMLEDKLNESYMEELSEWLNDEKYAKN